VTLRLPLLPWSGAVALPRGTERIAAPTRGHQVRRIIAAAFSDGDDVIHLTRSAVAPRADVAIAFEHSQSQLCPATRSWSGT
jgi:hypothetical protein